jgi:rsbT co-antagonist protein RsbR
MPSSERGTDRLELAFTPQGIHQRLSFLRLGADDLARIASIRDLITARVDDYVGAFFEHLPSFGRIEALFDAPALLRDAKRLKRDHLVAMVQGRYGKDYVDERLELARLYGRVELEISLFLGAYHRLMAAIGFDIMAQYAEDPHRGFSTFVSLKKVGFFDMAIIIDVLLAARERKIALQQDSIRELSTPVLQLRDGLLILPIVGMVDTRARGSSPMTSCRPFARDGPRLPSWTSPACRRSTARSPITSCRPSRRRR